MKKFSLFSWYLKKISYICDEQKTLIEMDEQEILRHNLFNAVERALIKSKEQGVEITQSDIESALEFVILHLEYAEL